jgi:hypothetical protein
MWNPRRAAVRAAQAFPQSLECGSRRRSSSGSPARWRSASRPPRVSEGAAGALAVEPEGRSGDDRRLSLPNEVLRARKPDGPQGLSRKLRCRCGFAVSLEIKAGEHSVRAPLLFAPDLRRAARRIVTIDRPDILIFEGINVLQVRDLPEDGKMVPFVSDYFDFSIYIDADEDDIHKWYVTGSCGCGRPRSAIPNPSSTAIRELSRKTPRGHCRGLWDEYQPEEPQGKHPADAPARRPDPAQGPQPSHRAGGVAQAVAGLRNRRKFSSRSPGAASG